MIFLEELLQGLCKKNPLQDSLSIFKITPIFLSIEIDTFKTFYTLHIFTSKFIIQDGH